MGCVIHPGASPACSELTFVCVANADARKIWPADVHAFAASGVRLGYKKLDSHYNTSGGSRLGSYGENGPGQAFARITEVAEILGARGCSSA